MSALAHGSAAALLLAALAGCVGGGGGDADVQGGASASGSFSASSSDDSTSSSTTSRSNSTSSTGPNSTSNATTPAGNQTNATGSANATEWRYDNRSGSLSGNELLLVHAASATESFEGENGTPNGTLSVHIDLAVDGDDVTMSVRPPGCDDDACLQTATTSDGAANLSFSDPPAGDWSVELAIDGGLGPVSSEYDLSFGIQVPAANATHGNETANATSGNATSTSSTTGTSSATSSTSASQTSTGTAGRR